MLKFTSSWQAYLPHFHQQAGCNIPKALPCQMESAEQLAAIITQIKHSMQHDIYRDACLSTHDIKVTFHPHCFVACGWRNPSAIKHFDRVPMTSPWGLDAVHTESLYISLCYCHQQTWEPSLLAWLPPPKHIKAFDISTACTCATTAHSSMPGHMGVHMHPCLIAMSPSYSPCCSEPRN